MVRVIGCFARELTGRDGAVDDLARGRAQRVQIRTVEVLAADVEDRERFAVDFNDNLRRVCVIVTCARAGSAVQSEKTSRTASFMAPLRSLRRP